AAPGFVAAGPVEVGDGDIEAVALGQPVRRRIAQVFGQLEDPVALRGAPAVAAVPEVDEVRGIAPLHADRTFVRQAARGLGIGDVADPGVDRGRGEYDDEDEEKA